MPILKIFPLAKTSFFFGSVQYIWLVQKRGKGNYGVDNTHVLLLHTTVNTKTEGKKKRRREPCLLYTKSDLLGQVSGLLICFVEIYLGWGFCRDLATLPCELQNSTHRTDRGRKKGFLQSLYLKNKKKKKKKKRVAYLLWSVYLNITYCTLYALSKCKQI